MFASDIYSTDNAHRLLSSSINGSMIETTVSLLITSSPLIFAISLQP